MKILVEKNTNIVIDIALNMEYVENGIQVGEITYANCIQANIVELSEVPAEVKPTAYCYTAEKGFYSNPNYVPVVDVNKTLLEQAALIKSLQEQIVSTQEAVNMALGV